MKKARFTESPIVSILKLADSSMKIDEVFRRMGSVTPRITTGNQNTVVWKPPILNSLKSLSMRMPDLKSCLRKSAWEIML